MSSINITNNFLADVTWLDASACNFKINAGIDVWKISSDLNQTHVDSFKTILADDEIDRANRFYQQKDRNRFTTSRAALRIILGKYLNIPPKVVAFAPGLNKK